MIPIETVTPVVNATLDAIQSVPLENIAYVPTEVFVQYTYIQMVIDGMVAGALGFVLGWKLHGRKMNKQQKPPEKKSNVMFFRPRGEPK